MLAGEWLTAGYGAARPRATVSGDDLDLLVEEWLNGPGLRSHDLAVGRLWRHV